MNSLKTSAWIIYFAFALWIGLSIGGLTDAIVTPADALLRSVPFLPLGLALAFVGGRAALSRDVGATDAIIAVAPVGLAVFLANASLPHANLGGDQWAFISLVGGLLASGAIACAPPSLSPNWKVLDNGTRIRTHTMKQTQWDKSLIVTHQEDSRDRHKIWARRNITLKLLIAVCLMVIAVAAKQVNLEWLVVWLAVAVEVYCLTLFGWGQFVRLDFVTYHPVEQKTTDTGPPKHQTQTQQARRKKIS